MKEQDVFFVGVENTTELRRNILESLKQGIESLQSYEKLKNLMEEKNKNTAKLKSKLREISGLVNDLKDIFPKTGLKVKSKPKEIKQRPKKIIIEPKIIPKEMTELEKLEKELSNIESKLNTLA